MKAAIPSNFLTFTANFVFLFRKCEKMSRNMVFKKNHKWKTLRLTFYLQEICTFIMCWIYNVVGDYTKNCFSDNWEKTKVQTFYLGIYQMQTFGLHWSSDFIENLWNKLL